MIQGENPTCKREDFFQGEYKNIPPPPLDLPLSTVNNTNMSALTLCA